MTSQEEEKEPATRENRCPRKKGFWYVNLETGQVAPARCKANKCPICGPLNAHLVAGAIGLAKPERAILLTDVGADWPQIRNHLKVFNYRLRKRTRAAVNMAWHVEPNPAGTGHHVHGWQWGDFLPQRAVSECAASVGMGKVAYISKVRAKPGAKGYGLKLAGVGYGLKMAEAEDSMRTYLEANGGSRLVHATRGFWRDEDGKPFTGQREAMTAWAGRHAASENEGRWVLVREEHLMSARLAALGAP